MDTRLIIREEAESTQDLARDLAVRGESEGLAVMALSQTGGRGRVGRAWVSPRGKNLALSLILRPDLDPDEAMLLGLSASIAAAETLEEKGVVRADLKWPNDVLVRGLKIAGILPEARVNGNRLEFVIIGVGINVNAEESDFPPDLRTSATSLFMSTGKRADLEDVALSFLARAGALYDRIKREGCGFIPALWETRWAHKGRMLTRDDQRGRAEGLDGDGALLLRTGGGRLLRIYSGEVEPARFEDPL